VVVDVDVDVDVGGGGDGGGGLQLRGLFVAGVVVTAAAVGMSWGLGFLKGGRCFGW
jgi:hypothetical protein